MQTYVTLMATGMTGLALVASIALALIILWLITGWLARSILKGCEA